MDRYYFTILTPTYNRSHTLERVYESLRRQTFENFEWLVIDDGSNDGSEELINRLSKTARFPIRYFYKKNGGKHTAMNFGFQRALGELIIVFDSDDWCISTALEKIAAIWENLSEIEKEKYSGISALKVYTDGTVIGDRYPQHPKLINYVDRFNRRITGDKWEIIRRDLCQRYLYPEISGERYLAPSLPWLKIGEKHHTIFTNEKLSIVDYLEDGISKNNILYRSKNPKGSCLVYAHRFKVSQNIYCKLKSVINLHRFVFHGGSFKNCGAYSIIGVIVGFFFYCCDLLMVRRLLGVRF